MDLVQIVAVIAANAALPGSGVLVTSGFELLKVCVEVAQILSGMGESASSIATQRENIREDVEEFAYVLGLLKQRVGDQSKLSEGLQLTILRFEGDMRHYNRVMAKFKSRTLLKQLIFRKEMDSASATTKKTTDLLKERLNLECSIAASNYGGVLQPQSSVSVEKLNQTRAPAHNEPDETETTPVTETHVSTLGLSDQTVVVVSSRSPAEELKVREKRYMAQADSPEITTEMADVETQKEILALLKSVDKRHRDPVVSVLKEKLRSSSSAAVKNEVNSLPSWHLTEDQVETDETTTLGFGGDAQIYAGVLCKKTPVAVKVFSLKATANKRLEEKAKLRFIETLKLWRRLRHRSICRLHGACYLTKTPSVVMELCDLGPLDKFLRRDESLRRLIAIELLLQAAEGVLKMHCSGIVHGDLKCDNILIQSTEAGKSIARRAKVCDFDRSFDWSALKSKKAKSQQRLEDMAAAVMDVEITGATPWLAPECVQGRLPSPASDVYAFGMTLYQALTGKPPFYHVNTDEVLKKWKLEHKLPRRETKLIAGDVWELIKRTSHADPFKRPSMQEVMSALKGFIAKAQQQTEKEAEANQKVDGDLEDQDVAEVATSERPADGESATTGKTLVSLSSETPLRELRPEIVISIVEEAPGPTVNVERSADQGAPAEAQQQPLGIGSADQQRDEELERVKKRREQGKLMWLALFLLLLFGLLVIYFGM